MTYGITANHIATAAILLAAQVAVGTAQAQYATQHTDAGVTLASGSVQRTTHSGPAYYAPSYGQSNYAPYSYGTPYNGYAAPGTTVAIYGASQARLTKHTGNYAPNSSPYRRHYAAPAQTYAYATPTHSSPFHGPTHAPSAPHEPPTTYYSGAQVPEPSPTYARAAAPRYASRATAAAPATPPGRAMSAHASPEIAATAQPSYPAFDYVGADAAATAEGGGVSHHLEPRYASQTTHTEIVREDIVYEGGQSVGNPDRDHRPEFYVEAGVGTEYIELPTINGMSAIIAGGGGAFVATADPTLSIDDFGVNFHAKVSFPIDPHGSYLSPKLRNTRLNFEWDAGRFDTDYDFSGSTAAGQTLAILPIGGGVSIGTIAGASESFVLSVDTEHRYQYGQGTLEVPLTVKHGRTGTSLEFGVAGLFMKTEIHTTHSGAGGFHNLNEEASAWFVGPVVALNVKLPIRGPALRTVGHLRAFGFVSEGELDASQSINGAAPTNLHLEDEWEIGVRLDGRIGLEYAPGRGIESGFYLTGGWQDEVPQIVNPTGSGSPAAGSPLRLDRDDAFTWGAQFRLRVTPYRVARFLRGESS